MKIKSGISLVVLATTIIIMVILTGVVIFGIQNVVKETEKNEFVIELETIEDKVKEYYMLIGNLPIRPDKSYNTSTLLSELTEASKQSLLRDEINLNKDNNNEFLVLDTVLLELEINERGKNIDNTDVFVVATNSLNVYYLKGIEVDDIYRFSTVTLTDQNELEEENIQGATNVTLNKELSIIKSTNVWTNEIILEITNNLGESETLEYSIAGSTSKAVGEDKKIKVSANTMTNAEKTAFESYKTITITKLNDGSVVNTKEVNLDNLDIIAPILGTVEIIDATTTYSNVIKINSTDEGGSGIKAIYYDYLTKLVDDAEASYYLDGNEVNSQGLISFGKISKDGNISLPKEVKSIAVVAVDAAGNVTEVKTYTI